MISFACPHCEQPVHLEDDWAGQRGECPLCGKPITVPAASDSAAAPTVSHKRPTEKQAQRPTPPLLPLASETPTRAFSAPASEPGPTADLDGETAAYGPRMNASGHPRELTEFLAPPQAPDELGRLGTYRVLAILGHGGMGVVFRAEDPALKRLVALKAILPSLAGDQANRRRFIREAQAAAAIKDDHVVSIFQVSDDRGAPFVAMELLEGESLDTRIRRAPGLSMAEIVLIGRETALGLAAAHDRGLIHRDIKPANLWLERRGERGGSGPRFRVKVLDFGLARARNDDVHLTQRGAIVGTPAYMSPEQAEGRRLDLRSDLFSLGSVLYRLCTGELAFQGDSALAIMSALALATPKPPCELNAETPPAPSELVMRLLAKKPDERPESAELVAAALQVIEAKTWAGTTGAPVRSEPEVAIRTAPLPGPSERRDRRRNGCRSPGWRAASLRAWVCWGCLHSCGRARKTQRRGRKKRSRRFWPSCGGAIPILTATSSTGPKAAWSGNWSSPRTT
jgi:serine/threonine protein kinase